MPKVFKNSLLLLSVLIAFQAAGQAQSVLELKVVAIGDNASVLRSYRYDSQPEDSLTARKTLRSLISALHDDGYLLATLTRFGLDANVAQAEVSIGQRFKWLSLKAGNLDKALIRKAGFREERFSERPFRHEQVARILDRLVTYAERNGHPFARASIDSLYIAANQIGGVLDFNPGPPITFDSLDIESDFRIKSRFLGNYLGIRMGDLYDQAPIEGLGRALAGLPYLRVSEAPRLTFQNNEATLHLKLSSRKVNQIDGIVGFLPDANNDGALLVTGQFDLSLYNPFGTGKKIGLHWRRQNVESQVLNVEYEHPNVAGGPISVNLDFDFLKQDTTFTRRDFLVELNYRLGSNGTFNVFTHQQAANRISTVGLEEATVLPDVLDFDLAAYGLGFRWNSLDDFFLPRRGMAVSISGSVGNKKVRPNAALPVDLVRGIDLRNLQYEFALNFEKHSTLGQRFTLLNRLNAGLIINDQLFRNDAIRLGGLNSLRGFNENFFFTTRYASTTVEGRLFFDSLSYFMLFADLGVVYDGFSDLPQTDYPVGLGTGISFSTEAGIFNFVYALGRSNQSGPLSVNQSKIHFGFTSRF